jgi:iron complex transport system ATP-binding protein
MATVEFRKLQVELGGRAVLDAVDLQATGGEWVALIGPNGAGKTTALRATAGRIAYRGSVRVAGREVREFATRALAREIAAVPQIPTAPPALAVREYVLLGRTPHIPYFGREGRADHLAAERAMRRLDLEPLADRTLASLSGGERQRAVLARALAQEAPVLLLDEPTSALDIGRQQLVLELIDHLRAELGLTVLSAMHDLTLAALYADRLLLLSKGRAVACGEAGAVLTEALVAEHYRASVRILAANGSPPAVIPRRPAGAIGGNR